jgi:hypothetical protein
MSAATNNPTQVIQTLDAELDHEVSLVLYGRAALCLGFDNPPAQFAMTQDVDAIICLSQLPMLMEDDKFWEAQERANLKLESKGLYITHLFSEDQVFLRPEWEKHIVPLSRPTTRHLKLYRPDAVDLILTKMMRGNDTQDMEDIAFLIRHSCVTVEQMESAFECVRIPDVQELQDAYLRAKPTVRQILKQINDGKKRS